MGFSVLTMNKKPGRFPRRSHFTNNHRENVSNTIFFSYEDETEGVWLIPETRQFLCFFAKMLEMYFLVYILNQCTPL